MSEKRIYKVNPHMISTPRGSWEVIKELIKNKNKKKFIPSKSNTKQQKKIIMSSTQKIKKLNLSPHLMLLPENVQEGVNLWINTIMILM